MAPVEAERSARGSGLRGLLSEVIGGVQARLQLLVVEVQEERLRVAALLFNTVLAALFIGFGAVFLAVFLTLLWWDTHRLLVSGIATLVFFLLGVWAATNAARQQQAGSKLFSASLAELARDQDALGEDRKP